jgi:hypothetical protein
MATNATTPAEKGVTTETNRNGVRPKYLSLGTDGQGASHCYRTTDDTVIVVVDGGREIQRPLDAETDVDGWMGFVTARRGWERKQYGVGLVEMLADALEESA